MDSRFIHFYGAGAGPNACNLKDLPMKQNLPISKIIRLLSKIVRLSRDGLTQKERQEIVGDLLELTAVIIEGRE